jgi:hypothetical protein
MKKSYINSQNVTNTTQNQLDILFNPNFYFLSNLNEKFYKSTCTLIELF